MNTTQVREIQWGKAKLHSTSPAAQLPRVALKHPAWICVASAMALVVLGVNAINLTSGVNQIGLGHFAIRQLVFLPIGLLAAAIVATPHYKLIGRLTPTLALLTLGMLILVMLPMAPEWLVKPKNGARRWISLGVADFQPSEIAKIVYVLMLARYLRFRKNYRRLKGLVPPLALTFVPMAMIVIEPDLGTAMLFLPTFFAMLIAAGAKLKHLALLVLAASMLAPAMYPILKPHQRDRINAMWNQIKGDRRQADSINYQGFQAITLVGAGGVMGLGAEKSRAIIDFNDLPEDHNDMIFAVIVDRFGLVGAGLTIGLYLSWIGGALWCAALCKDPFGRLAIVGLASMVGSQAFINIGITLGLAPITGMTLPFVSYGGSSLIAAFMTTGLIVNIAMRRPAYLARKSFEFDEPDA